MSRKMRIFRYFLIVFLSVIIIFLILTIYFKNNNPRNLNTSYGKATILPIAYDSRYEINPSWEELLVNKDVLLPKKWKIDLTNINNVAVLKSEKINKKIVNEFNDLVNAASKAGIDLLVISAYRSVSAQENVYNSAVQQYQSMGYSKADAIRKTEETINKPRSSEHHTGLAIDIVGINAWSQVGNLDERLANTKEFKWLEQNAYKYGFILRYPKDKVNITKVNYEPWHFRFVGVNLATYLTKNHLTLEEYHNMRN